MEQLFPLYGQSLGSWLSESLAFGPPGWGVIKKENQGRFCTVISGAEAVLMTGIFPRIGQEF